MNFQTGTKWGLLLIACLSLAGCQSGTGKSGEFFLPRENQDADARTKIKTQKPPTPEQADLRLAEAIIRKFLADVADVQKTRPSVLYLSLTTNRLDPAPDYLKRVRVSGLQIKPLSSAPGLRNETGPSGRAVLFGIENTEWFDLFNVRATCSWSAGEPVRRYFAYDAQWQKNKWAVR